MTDTDDPTPGVDEPCPHIWRWLERMNGFVCVICKYFDDAEGDGTGRTVSAADGRP